MWLRPRGRDGLAQAVATCRHEAGLTQEQLAQRVGINRTTLIDMEAGRNRALARVVEALSVLGYDLLVVPRTAKVSVTEAVPTASTPVRDPASPAHQH